MNIEAYISSGILEQYVFGLCDAAEQNEVEQLQQSNSEVAAAILKIELELEANARKYAIEPSRILPNPFAVGLFEQNKPVETTPIVQIDKNKFLYRNIAAVLAVALAASVFYNMQQFNKNKAQANEIAAIQNIKSLPTSDFAVMQNPNITPVAMRGQGIHSICRCTLFWDKTTGKAYVMVHHLMPSGDSQDFQLWASVDGKPVSVGIINENIRDKFVEVAGIPENATEFNVTLEQAGGAQKPNLDQLWLKGTI